MSIVSSRSRALPPSIYWLSLCSFAFGLCEFIAAGLLSPMARDLHAGVAATGGAIAAYALGALLGVRFAVGLAHGVFMAVASHAATSLVDPSRAGRALSIVWLGLILALAGGVPLGTWLGAVASWRWVFAAIGVLALCGGAGLHCAMPAARQQLAAVSALASLRAILQPPLLLAAGVAALVSVATFSFFTYISPFLLQLGGLDAGWLSAAMLCFGACAIGGNLLGGWCADRPSALRATMLALCGTLGMLFFALVTLSTMRLLLLAQRYCPGSDAVAAGLNITAFNAGTALGGALAALLLCFQSRKLDALL